jgi:hypothetical protein
MKSMKVANLMQKKNRHDICATAAVAVGCIPCTTNDNRNGEYTRFLMKMFVYGGMYLVRKAHPT